MPVAAAPAIDAAAVRTVVRARLGPGRELVPLFETYLAGLDPERWTIEWHLPHWLATRFGLPGEVADALTESNVLGLLSVRLTDDLVDDDIDPADVRTARTLAAAALDAAMCPYRELFPPDSPLWPFFDRSMAAWRAGADGPEHATRAAPIKIAAFACCLLAGRRDVWPVLDRCLDHAMTALVLYDQFFDWELDVSAGRWNAFVAHVLGGDPAEGRGAPMRTRAAVLTAMLTREVVPEHFRRIAAEAEAAARLGDALGLDELAGYMRSWASAVVLQGDGVANHYGRAADQATRLMFPHAVAAPIGGGHG
jgi:hypothetical protein